MYELKKPFTQSAIFWLLLSCFSLLGIFFSFRFFSKTFPIVDLKITMDRHQALNKARVLAQEFKLKPDVYTQAASFESESEVQNFIELEVGGPKEFSTILKEGYYAPYFWKVRHFKEYEAAEAELFFTPDGKLYGFVQKLAEDEPGEALTLEQAQEKAMYEAKKHWSIDFALYKLVETGHETTSTGRIDYTFVFERTDKKIGEAPYRLKLVVRGDRLTEVKLSVKVPKNFERKYEEMRSSNNFIAFSALIIMIILYIFGGCFIGLFFLARGSLLEFKWPFFWALFIGLLQVLNDINQMPFYWFDYDTAVSMQQFIGHIIIKIIYHFFMYVSASLLLITVAEGLTRKAFPKKIQLWKIWSPLAGSSVQVLGRTLGGYLILGIDFAYCIAFYYLALKFFGWWSPSEALYNPNALASYFPWISPIATSLSAGFLEESLFRAIPLACAALLGDRFGKKNIWIGVAFIVQALIFGAVHANYPAQPAYARLVELIIPSFVFGFMYLRYGLLPAIISHFIFDVFWFSLPIFISHAPGILFDKVMIILICLIPLLLVFIRRLQHKVWIHLPEYFYNAAWEARPLIERQDIPIEEIVTIHWSKQKKIQCLILGLLGLIMWAAFTRFWYDTTPLMMNRNDALSYARKMLPLDSSNWTLLTSVELPLDSKARNQHIYIWRTFGKDMYKKLLKNYLIPAVFKVRFAQFEGSIDERSEEYELFIGGDKSTPIIRRINHHYPENFFLDSLSKQEALKIVYEYSAAHYSLNEQDLAEISAIPTQLQQRTDWKFIFNDIQHELGLSQAHIAIEVAGKNVVDSFRYIFVPEQWDRLYKNEKALVSLLDAIRLFLFFILIACASAAVLIFSRRSFSISLKITCSVMIILLLKSLIQASNIWPYAIANFNTSEPFSHQAWHTILFWLVYAIFIAGIYALVIGFMQTRRFKSPQVDLPFTHYAFIGILIGLIEVGYFALAKSLMPHIYPQWPTITHAGAYIPWLGQALSMLSNFIEWTMLALIIFTAVDYVALGCSKKCRRLILPFLMGIGLVMLDVHDFMPLWSLLLVGLLWGTSIWLLYFFVLRNTRASIPCIIATVKIFGLVPLVVFNAFPGVLLGAVIGSVLVGALALFWSYQLYSKSS